MAVFRCTAAGDSMVFRRFPGEYAGFPMLRDFIARGDFRFFNLETTVHDFEVPGNVLSGGSWFCAEPKVLHDMHRYGFNATTTATNHATDYGIEGLLKTVEYAKQEDFAVSGAGRNLGEASAPAYLETLEGRYALISCTSTFSADSMACEQTRIALGHPGVNGIRFDTVYHVDGEDIEAIRRIAEKTHINANTDILRKEGYKPPLPEGVAELGSLLFSAEGENGIETHVKKQDLERMEKAIRDARFFADYVVISFHSHEIRAMKKEEPAQFMEEFVHACIDFGADAVIGTGPHLLRPIEIYKGKPVFYSLGDFILQNETMKTVPAGMFEKQGLTGNEPMCEMYARRSDGGKKGLYYSPVMHEAVVPYWEETDGKLTELALLPVEMTYARNACGGLPVPCFDKGILERLAEMSRPYGTEITVDADGIGHVKL